MFLPPNSSPLSHTPIRKQFDCSHYKNPLVKRGFLFSITKDPAGEIEKFERINNILRSKIHFFLPLEMNF